MTAMRSSTSSMEYSSQIFLSSSALRIWLRLSLCLRNSFSRMSRPRAMLLLRSSVLIQALIFETARDVTACLSQSLLGWRPAWVMISTVSPFWSW